MFYHTMHSPRGACASFVLGAKGEAGGFMHQQGFIPENEVYIGVLDGMSLRCLPFFVREDMPDAEEKFDIGKTQKRKVCLCKYTDQELSRALDLTSDCWDTPDFRFELLTPAKGLPDPESADGSVKQAVAPLICAKFTVKNEKGHPVTGFFGVQGLKGVYPLSEANSALLGAAGAGGYGFGMDAGKYGGVCTEVADFSPASLFGRARRGFYRNCEMGGFCFEVTPGAEISVDFVLGWYLAGPQTRGTHAMPYFYTRYFDSLEQVLLYGATHFTAYQEEASHANRLFAEQPVSMERRFLIAQSVHCYWASTMLFSEGGKPRYVVNEGSYMMMNTFDLSVDHLFYECFAQPWCVKNQLDSFLREYAYEDTLHGQDGRSGLPGGISFTHDQGSYGTFSPPGYSSYEMPQKDGCLSYMSQEQLLNWLLSAAVYVEISGDEAWRRAVQQAVAQCLESLLNRDDPAPGKRDGIMDYDGDRCGTAGEITTYDSLDEGLGQARRNLYLAVKGWAGYLAAAKLSDGLSEEAARCAREAAHLCAGTIAAAFDEGLGYIPAILDGCSETAIIPAVEGLVYPLFFGAEECLQEDGPYGMLVSALKRHLRGVLKPGVCVFPDGGWRLSSGSNNSWMSKIFLCEFVAETVLGISPKIKEAHPDIAHSQWWRQQCARCPGIDQVLYGQPYSRGFHYPRAVTSVLWLRDAEKMLRP